MDDAYELSGQVGRYVRTGAMRPMLNLQETLDRVIPLRSHVWVILFRRQVRHHRRMSMFRDAMVALALPHNEGESI